MKAMKKVLCVALLFVVSALPLVGCQQHKHEYSDWVVTEEATCTQIGEKVRTCACGEELKEPIDMKEHKYSEWVVTIKATCTKDGEQVRKCDCGAEQTEVVDAIGHKYGDWTIVKKATCETDGQRSRECSCGEKQTEKIKATGHSYGSWKTTKAASCTKDGVQTRTCSCGDKEQKAISATGHSWKDATCESAKKCTKCSTTTGSALGHKKGSDGYCTRCGDKLTIDMNTVVGHPDDCSAIDAFGFCFYKNSADGIKVCWGGKNLSSKTINYYSVTIYFYNAVGDPAYSEITGKSSKTVKYVGPVAPGDDLIIFGIVDYVPVCSKVAIGEITLEYADGTSDTGWYGWSTTYKNSAIK